jgi:hypothetical protein
MSFVSSREDRRATSIRARRPSSHKPQLEVLEDRLAPATFTVLNTNDAGLDSLRQAILDANSNPGFDAIHFNIPTSDPGYNAGTGSFRIQPTSSFPTITSPVVIDGTSQPGFATVNRPVVELNGLLNTTNHQFHLSLAAR